VDDEEPLTGGNVSEVVRVGATVRRSTGPWTPGSSRCECFSSAAAAGRSLA
jgi:hypothetical protein